jgi:hypothetical protein
MKPKPRTRAPAPRRAKAPAPAVKPAPAPRAVKLLRDHGFINDYGAVYYKSAGTIITNPVEIALLKARMAHLEDV